MKPERIKIPGYDEVWRVDLEGTIAFVSLHAIIRNRTFGGIRIRPYPNEKAALRDAMALSLAMSRKVALTGIEGGGAKTVVMAPEKNRSEVIRKLGVFIDSLHGRYYAGADFGCTSEDISLVAQETKYVASEDLSPHTARTVLLCLEALDPPKVAAVQGLGSIGLPVAKALQEQGVRVIASDLSPVKEFEAVEPDQIYETECDLFSPCATGGVLDNESIGRLRCKVICGGANNPLASDQDAERLRERGILYIPDFISNSGATIYGASKTINEEDQIESRFQAIPSLVREIITHAREENR
ncbi:MAG: Glu/Leu/Phe/Val dehydrogenase dimerization domain-containing protein, partial [Planctomycetota bacterium]|nr:Glu/Leu/Phe/Val dehydrogenase dimerization domain-containing protein [Planctomycetota bacterium]